MYLVGSLEKGLTVYSQQDRAYNLVWALWELSRPKPESLQRIAVVGGGIAGLTAVACTLSRIKQARITLFEHCVRAYVISSRNRKVGTKPRYNHFPVYSRYS